MMSECFCSSCHSGRCFSIFLSNSFQLACTYPLKPYRYLFNCHPWYRVNCRYQPQLEDHLRLISHMAFLKSVLSPFLALLKMVPIEEMSACGYLCDLLDFRWRVVGLCVCTKWFVISFYVSLWLICAFSLVEFDI